MDANTIQQPLANTFGAAIDDPNNPLNANDKKLDQPISVVFGEGSTAGSSINKPAEVIFDSEGKPKGLRINRHHGYTEATDLAVVKQPISTRFGEPLQKEVMPPPPLPNKKEFHTRSRLHAPKHAQKREDRPFMDF